MFWLASAPESFDAIVVGSGAPGGWAATVLAAGGMRGALLEAGKKITPRDFTEHKRPWDMPFLGHSPLIARDRPIQTTCGACTEYNYEWFVNDRENPYTQATPFRWIRQRVLGGRSMSWGRQSYRMSPLDLKAKTHDGYGDDWPVTYEELVPYYERVERYVGITGISEGLMQLPDSVFLPPMEMTCGEQLLRDAARQKMGRVVTMGRAAVLTQAQNGRQARHSCGPCARGCITESDINSVTTTIPDAQRTGRLTLFTDAVAARVNTRDGKATGVTFIDAATKNERDVRAKVGVLCASTLESTRLLLNSGICNSSGVLGHYLMDHIFRGGASGVMPMLEARAWAGPPRRAHGHYVNRVRHSV